jgi:hypothetical protein
MEKNIHIIKSVPLDFGTIELRSDNILTYEPTPHLTTLNLQQLEIMTEVLLELCEGKPKPFLSDNKNLTSFGYAEREYVGKNIHQFASCSAILEESFVTRFIHHSILFMFKPQVPLRLFKTKEEAILWLNNHNA